MKERTKNQTRIELATINAYGSKIVTPGSLLIISGRQNRRLAVSRLEKSVVFFFPKTKNPHPSGPKRDFFFCFLRFNSGSWIYAIHTPTGFIFTRRVGLPQALKQSALFSLKLKKKGLSTTHVKMGLTDLRDSHCVSVVLIKAFSVLLL